MVLAVENLFIHGPSSSGPVAVVESLTLALPAATTLALVGESGCGKTITALSIMGLLPPGFFITSGSVKLGGEELTFLSKTELRQRRGKSMAMIFQEPMTALNPVMTVGRQITEVLLTHRVCPPSQARDKAIALLGQVGLKEPEKRFSSYPHEFSGGMRQRVMCVMAICANPQLIIADEPTTALDATVQAQILELLRELQSQSGAAILLITHNLLAASILADRLTVLYAGSVMETGPTAAVLNSPAHPYTRGLLGSQPRLRLGRDALCGIPPTLAAISGQVPPPGRRPLGCAFFSRCPQALKDCRDNRPHPVSKGPEHQAACFR
ncbi:MAG: ABC transporter ATP-binding protein [Deltaproteobacteria bacterium]|nr:ABC transporter ATP-binding protein [Deltaproteobacteria bacterium]